jgi:hypothetical protein
LDFTQGSTYNFDLLLEMQQRWIDVVKAVYIDNSANNSATILQFGSVGMKVQCRANRQGIFPAVMALGDARITATSAGNLMVPVVFFNVDLPPQWWDI